MRSRFKRNFMLLLFLSILFSILFIPTIVNAEVGTDGQISAGPNPASIGQTLGILVVDSDPNTDPGLRETVTICVTSTSDPTGFCMNLTENGTNSDNFTGYVKIADATKSYAADPPEIAGVDGGEITFHYFDERNADPGMPNIERTFTISVEGRVPQKELPRLKWVENYVITSNEIGVHLGNISLLNGDWSGLTAIISGGGLTDPVTLTLSHPRMDGQYNDEASFYFRVPGSSLPLGIYSVEVSNDGSVLPFDNNALIVMQQLKLQPWAVGLSQYQSSDTTLSLDVEERNGYKPYPWGAGDTVNVKVINTFNNLAEEYSGTITVPDSLVLSLTIPAQTGAEQGRRDIYIDKAGQLVARGGFDVDTTSITKITVNESSNEVVVQGDYLDSYPSNSTRAEIWLNDLKLAASNYISVGGDIRFKFDYNFETEKDYTLKMFSGANEVTLPSNGSFQAVPRLDCVNPVIALSDGASVAINESSLAGFGWSASDTLTIRMNGPGLNDYSEINGANLVINDDNLVFTTSQGPGREFPLQPGYYYLEVHRGADRLGYTNIIATDNPNDVLTGIVLDSNGIPANGGYININKENEGWGDRILVGHDGKFYAYKDNLRGDGKYFLTAIPGSASDDSPGSYTLNITGGNFNQNVTINLQNTILTGRVLKPDGSVFLMSPDSNVEIMLNEVNSKNNFWAGINGEGVYKFGGNVPDGLYSIVACDRGVMNPFARSIPTTVQITAGTVVNLDLSLTNPVITGKVMKPDSTLFIPGDQNWVNISLRTTGPNEWDISQADVNNDGSFRLGGSIPTGDYRLNASTDGKNNPYSGAAPIDIHIDEGQTYYIEISLTNPIVSGFIYKPDGSIFSPEQDSWVDVDLRYSNGNGFTWTYVYGDGHYRFNSYVPDGDYILVARGKGPLNPYADSPNVNITVSGGQPVTQDLTLTNPVITGRILQPDGSAFVPDGENWAGARLRSMDWKTEVTRFDLEWDCTYRLGGNVTPGDYFLVADAWGNNNPFTSSLPIQIHLVEGLTYNYDLYLTVPAVSGKILKPDGSTYTPEPGSWGDVCLRGMDGKDMWTGVDGSGSYRFGGVSDGEYILFVHSRGNQNPYSDSQRVNITIAGGQPVTQDLTFTNTVITGRVLKPDGSEFIPGDECWANARVMFMDGKEVTWFDLDGDCNFRLGGGIAPGDYFLAADAWGSNNPFTSSQFIQIHLEAGQTLVQDINLTNPAISGRILKPDGSNFMPDSVSWADVCLRDMNGKDRMWTGVNNDGTYKFGGVPDGDYKIFVASRGDGNPFADSMPVPVSVTSGQTTTRDLSLTNPSLKGFVLKPDGAIFTRGDNSWADVVLRDSNGWDVGWSGINNDGSFKFSGDITDGDYIITAYDRGINNPFAKSAPVPIHLTPGSVMTQDISLTVPVIYGKVYKPDGAPFIPGDECWGNVRLRTTGPNEWDIADSGVNDDGSFRLGGSIPAGDYKLNASADGNKNPYANAIPIDIYIENGQSYHVDISLTNPSVTGYIHKPDGSLFTPDQGSWVDVALRNPDGKDFAWTGVQGDGRYKFNDYIPDGEYLLFAHSRGNQNPFTDSPRVNITISGGQPVIQDLTLTTPVITGKILKPDGSEFIPDNEYWAGARLRDMNGKDVTWFDLDGDCNFRLGGNIEPGDYNLVADAWGNNNPYTSSQPIQIHLEAGQTVYQDLYLTVPVVMGKILKPDGSVYIPDFESWADVCIRDMNGKDLMWTGVDGSGSYRFGGTISDGDYRLTAYDRGRNNPFAKSLSVDIHYTSGMTVVKDLTLTYPSIAGTVLAPDGSPFTQRQDAWANVILRTTEPEEKDVFDTGVNDGGVFRIGGVPDGNYRLYAYTDGRMNPYCGSKPLNVQVENGNVKNAEVSLTMPVLSGYILTPAGDPFIPGEDSDAGVAINTVGPNGEENGWGWSTVNYDGRYKFGWEIPEGDYVLHAYVWGLNNGYVNSAPLNVHVNSASSASQDIYLTNPVITGRILKPDGTVFTLAPGLDLWFKLILTLPDGKRINEGAVYPDGTYRIGGSVHSGDYRLNVECGGKDIPYTGSIPVSIHIPEGQTYSVDLTLTEPMVEGRLLNPEGEQLTPGPDSGFRILLTDVNDVNKIFRDMVVNSDGSFRLGGNIKDGDYNLVADTANADPKRYDYTNSLPVRVSLRSGNKITQDMKLTNPSVEGKILKPDGSAFDPGENSGIWLFLKSPDGKECGSAWIGSGSKGSFRFGGDVPQGDYKIFAVTAWSGSPYTDPVAVPVHITTGETVTCEVRLTNPLIKGRLLTPEGKIVSEKADSFYYIALVNINSKNVCTARTTVSGGEYKLGGYIPAGDYNLYVFAAGAGNPYEDSAPVPIRIRNGSPVKQDIRLTKPLLKGQVLTPNGTIFTQEAGLMTFAALSRDKNLTEADWKNIGNWDYDFWRFNSNPWLTSTLIATVNANGTFSFGGNIAPGGYNLFVHVDTRSVFKDSTPVKVTIVAGKLTNVNVRLNARSSDASVRSVAYKVDNIALVISNVPYDTPLNAFYKSLVPAAGAKYMVLQSDGMTEVTSGCIKTGMKVKVVAEDGKTTRVYSIKTNPYIEKEIKSFTVRVETRNAVTRVITNSICNGVINKVNHTVTLKVPNSVNVKLLKPVITISPNTTINFPSGSVVNLSSPVIYQIKDKDGAIQEWKVICIIEAAGNVKR